MAAKKGPVNAGPDPFAVIPVAASTRYRQRLVDAATQTSINQNPEIEPYGELQVIPISGSVARQAISLYESHRQLEFREYYNRTFGFDVSV